MSIEVVAKDLSLELEDTLRQLKNYRREDEASVPAEALPSLLEQCQQICDTIRQVPPIRSLHHFACSGGTLISKCIALLPNSILLSEIDPLSTMGATLPGHGERFAPTDLILGLRRAAREVHNDVLVEVFRRGVSAAHENLSRQGYNLILRDHSHSHFCTKTNPISRPTLHEILQPCLPLRSVVTVRHPLASFLSLTSQGWVQFKPATLEEYSRRYLLFLDRHAHLPVVLYENFVNAPEKVLEQLCSLLDLPFNPLVIDLLPAIEMSGDSGRSGASISRRPRREVPQHISDSRQTSREYRALCERLGYDP